LSVIYIAPFFENNALGEASTAYAGLLSKYMDVTCRPIGGKETEKPNIVELMKNKGGNYLVIHSKPEDFCWKAGFKKVVGITHLKSPLIEETDFQQNFSLMDEVYHDSSFILPGTNNINPFCDKKEYQGFAQKTEEKDKTKPYKFLIVGEPTCYEEIYMVIRAYCEEFRGEENVDLTLKTNPKFNVAQFSENIKILQSHIRKYNNPVYPQLSFNNVWHNRQDLLKFYDEFDCVLNCNLHNSWSKPFLDCLMLQKRGISLIDDTEIVEKQSYGPSEHKDYPVGTSRSFVTKNVKQILRDTFSGKRVKTSLNIEDFTEEKVLTQLMAIFS